MRPEVLGIHSLDGHADPREWDLSGQSEAGKLWSTLRSMPESGYLGMTTPRFMGRLPYGADWEPLEAFSFEEFDNPPDHNNYLWINSSFACGLLLCQSFSAIGWEMGRSFVQDIDRLPPHTYEADGETVYTPCAEVQMTHDACDKLMEYGLMPLVSYKNSDHVKLARFQSITDPVTGLSGKWRRG
jgi:type VI secretion system protein ImpC